MLQQVQIAKKNLNSLKEKWTLPGLLVVATTVSVLTLYFLSFSPAIGFILFLWAVALSTVILPINYQLTFFWLLLPFVDLLKRVVFLDEGGNTTHMYLVLITQDVILLTVLFKLFLTSLHSPIKVRFLSVDVVLGLFLATGLLSAFFSPGAPLDARVAAAGMRVWPIVTYYLAARYLSNAIAVPRLVKLTIILTLVVALYGIWQFFFGFLPFEVAWVARAANSSNVAHLQHGISRGVFRVFATLDSHSSYGIFLGIGLILTWAYRYRLGRFIWLVVSIILLFGLILSFTRFTWLMPILATGFIFLFSYSKILPLFDVKKWRKASILILGIVASFFIFYAAMNSLYGRRLVSTSNPYLVRAFGTSTLEARLRTNNLLATSGNSVLLGQGLANSGFFSKKFGFETTDVNFHNIFVDMVDSMGVVGLGIFLWFLYLLIKQSIINIETQTDRRTRRLLVALLALVLAMVTVGHFNGAVFYFGRALPAYFWAFCGILAHYRASNSLTVETGASYHSQESR